MALPILDGNQSATTLSTILSSGQHIPAHTVVSLGTQAITDMRGAVSGSVVSISNLPSTQTIAGTVTANTRNNGISNDPWVYIPNLTMNHPDTGNIVLTGYYRFDGANQWGTPILNSGNYGYLIRFIQGDAYWFRLMVHDDSNDQEITFAEFDGGQTSDFPTSMYTVSGTVVSGSLTFNTEQRESYGVRVTNSVTVGNSVTIGSLPAISGTVTANGLAVGATVANVFPIGVDTQFSGVRTVTDLIGYRLPISLGDSSAVVSASLSDPLPAGTNRIGVVTIGGGTVTIGAGTAQIGSVTASISGTVPVSGTFFQATQPVSLTSLPALVAGTAQIGSVTASISNSVTIASLPAISGTVTANSSNGSLTTRFGSVVTANEPFETSAVTNANRKYLLIQNTTTASNVITVGIGFTPTTTQGIQLFAGAGLTFEGSYIPTGAVNLLSSVTASCYTILEA